MTIDKLRRIKVKINKKIKSKIIKKNSSETKQEKFNKSHSLDFSFEPAMKAPPDSQTMTGRGPDSV